FRHGSIFKQRSAASGPKNLCVTDANRRNFNRLRGRQAPCQENLPLPDGNRAVVIVIKPIVLNGLRQTESAGIDALQPTAMNSGISCTRAHLKYVSRLPWGGRKVSVSLYSRWKGWYNCEKTSRISGSCRALRLGLRRANHA